MNNKVGAFADDVGMAVKNDPQTVNEIFKTYQQFSSLSGIELNVDKTEILQLNVDSTHSDFATANITVENKTFKTVESVKICGIVFSNNQIIAYNENIIDKIERLEKQLVRWLARGLSLEGKILIVKTFGLSQMIYSLQICEITDRDVINIERIIFKFLWNRKWLGNPAPDRIKRSTLKLDYDKGGLRVPDISILDKALKTKQFIRASNSNHPIKWIQLWCMEDLGYPEIYKIEYRNYCSIDSVIKTYQKTVTEITDAVRSNTVVYDNGDTVASIIASTDVFEYLSRKKLLLVRQCFVRLAMEGIESYHDLYNEYRFPRSDTFGNLARDVIGFLPGGWVRAMQICEQVNNEINYSSLFPAPAMKLVNVKKITVKSIRTVLLETSIPPIHAYVHKLELDIGSITHNPFIQLRHFIKVPRDRFFKYRILHGDVFCNDRKYRFRMSDSPNCEFCGEVENVKHLVWTCQRSRDCWEYFNRITAGHGEGNYATYETVVMGAVKPVRVLEEIVVLILRLIMTKDRSNSIEQVAIQNSIKTKYSSEKILCNNLRKLAKLDEKWETMAHFLQT